MVQSTEKKESVITGERMERIFQLENQINKLNTELNSLKDEVEKEMKEIGISSYEGDIYKIHYKSGNCTEKFDLTKFEKEDKVNFAIYFEKYKKLSIGKDSFAWSKKKKFED